ncbi:MAG: ABC transporter permease [Armatimonadetes bacterium]|nr:ABC transporter permease [Armatimonadota bacterium]
MKQLRLPPSALNLAALAIVWALVFAYFSALAPRFGTIDNVQTLARQATVVCLSAIGMTFVIITGGIDLSVASIMAFVTVVIAKLLDVWPPGAALLAGVGAGALCGAVNGLLITRLKVAPFIVTLGTYLIVRGAAKGLASEQKVDAPITWLNSLVARLGAEQQWMIFPVGVWLLIVLAVAAAVTLKYTRFGRYVVAVGANETATRLSGVAVDKVKTAVYTLNGLFAGLAGLMLFSRLSVGDPTVAIGQELDVIAAVVIGGASLSGCEGSIFGSMIGALIMATLRAGGSQLGWPNWRQEMITGAIIVLSVALDRYRARKRIG